MQLAIRARISFTEEFMRERLANRKAVTLQDMRELVEATRSSTSLAWTFDPLDLVPIEPAQRVPVPWCSRGRDFEYMKIN